MTARTSPELRRIVAIVFALLGGCATVQVDPQTAKRNGIATVAESVGEVDVIMIHGMSYEDKSWAAATNAALADALGGSFDATEFAKTPGIDLGEQGAKLFLGSIVYGKSAIHTYAILWSPITVPFKRALCYDVSTANPPVCPTANGESRALLNGFFKSTLLDGALSDVVFYLGDEWGGIHAIRSAVTEAVRIILSGGKRSNSETHLVEAMETRSAPLFIMTESLGSKILWDSINGLACTSSDQGRNALIKALGRVDEVFMAANQIPILSPTESAAPAADCVKRLDESLNQANKPLSGLRGFSALVRAGKKKKRDGEVEPLKIIAFSDPNDILSYKLRPYFVAECSADPTLCNLADVVDVGPHNDTNWFGLVENPATAHTSYWNTPFVKRVLKCGLPQTATCH
jgi:hypothetical protein